MLYSMPKPTDLAEPVVRPSGSAAIRLATATSPADSAMAMARRSAAPPTGRETGLSGTVGFGIEWSICTSRGAPDDVIPSPL